MESITENRQSAETLRAMTAHGRGRGPLTGAERCDRARAQPVDLMARFGHHPQE